MMSPKREKPLLKDWWNQTTTIRNEDWHPRNLGISWLHNQHPKLCTYPKQQTRQRQLMGQWYYTWTLTCPQTNQLPFLLDWDVSSSQKPLIKDYTMVTSTTRTLIDHIITYPDRIATAGSYETCIVDCTSIRTSKATYLEQEFQKSNDSKSFWSTVKKFQGNKINKHWYSLIHENQPVTSNINKANLMNNFLSTVGKNLAEITFKTALHTFTKITPKMCVKST